MFTYADSASKCNANSDRYGYRQTECYGYCYGNSYDYTHRYPLSDSYGYGQTNTDCTA